MILDGVGMSFYRGRITVDWLVSLTFLLAATPAQAADTLWDKPESGDFSTDTNWFGGVPGPNDVARFETTNSDLFPRAYNVDFSKNPTNQQLVVEDDNVSFRLSGHTYSLMNQFVAVALGTVPSRSGNLRITGGTLNLPSKNPTSATDLEIAPVANASGVLTVSAGGRVIGAPDVLVGLNGDGILNINSRGGATASEVTIGVNNGSMGTAEVTGAGSTLNVLQVLTVGKRGLGTLNITGGGQVTCREVRIGFNELSSTVQVASTLPGDISILTVDSDLKVGDLADGRGTLLIQTGGAVSVGGNAWLAPQGLLRLEGGALSAGTIFNDSVTPIADRFLWTAGTLRVRQFNGDLVVPSGGIIVPAFAQNGTVIDGDYDQQAPGSTLAYRVSGPTIFDENGFISSHGSAVLGGALQVTLVDGFVPSPEHLIAVLSATKGITGQFANVANGQRLTTSDGLGSFAVNYGPGSPFNPNHVILSAFAPGSVLPGDYNQDGTVDTADYVVWRNNVGSGKSLPNDNTPGVGQDDYTRWCANFGRTVGGGSNVLSADGAVPEPETHLVLILGLSLIVALRRFAVANRVLNSRRG
jgi:T5SS/PEP-CTERM-associated repeat protein